MFASVANDGRIEVWDLKRDNLQPLVCFFDELESGKRDPTPKTAVKFCHNLPVIMTGNVKGKVDVYRVNGLEHI